MLSVSFVAFSIWRLFLRSFPGKYLAVDCAGLVEQFGKTSYSACPQSFGRTVFIVVFGHDEK
jgi:hypothetical protein